MSSLIKLEKVSKRFGDKVVLHDINLNIDEGEIVGIVGANGSGKTTLVEMITKIISPTSGKILYKENFNIENELGIQFQEGYWPKGVTSKGIIKYFLGYTSNSKKDKWINELIDIFEIKEFYKKDLNNLSGGQKQRLNALLAVIKDPKFIVLDELITGLDSKMQKKLSDFFKEFVTKNESKTLITISHIPEEVEMFCERLILLSNGVVYYDDSVKNVIEKFDSIRNFLNVYYDNELEPNLDVKEIIEKQKNIKISIIDRIKNYFSNAVQNTRTSFDLTSNKICEITKILFKPNYKSDLFPNGFKAPQYMWIRNFILLFLSTFKNFRTYVYVIIIPVCLSLGLYYLSTFTQPSMFSPSRVSGFMLIPCFSIILLMNTLVSEWKASVFLKRIKVSGTSKFQFLSAIWSVGLILGLISFFINLIIFMIYGYFETYGYDWIYQALDSFGNNGYFGLIFAAMFIILMSMGISTLLAGSISSIGIAQSIGILIAVVFVAFSDVFLPTTIIGGSHWALNLSYFIPTKYGSWLSVITASGANLNWDQNSRFIFNTDDAMLVKYTFSFHSITMPIIGSLLWISGLFTVSNFMFKWSQKK